MNRKIANLLIILNFFWFLQNIECYLLRKLKEPNHFTGIINLNLIKNKKKSSNNNFHCLLMI